MLPKRNYYLNDYFDLFDRNYSGIYHFSIMESLQSIDNAVFLCQIVVKFIA